MNSGSFGGSKVVTMLRMCAFPMLTLNETYKPPYRLKNMKEECGNDEKTKRWAKLCGIFSPRYDMVTILFNL